MKKRYILMFVSLVLFCFFFYINGFCVVLHTAQPMGIPASISYELLGIYIAGIAIPWYIVLTLSVLAFSVFMFALIRIIKISHAKQKRLLLLIVLLPILLVIYQSQETEYGYWVLQKNGASDTEYFQSLEINEQDNTVFLSDSSYGFNDPIRFSVPPSVVISIKESLQNHKFFNFGFTFRENRLLRNKGLELVYACDKIVFRQHLQWFDAKNRHINFTFSNIDDLLSTTPTPAPTRAPISK